MSNKISNLSIVLSNASSILIIGSFVTFDSLSTLFVSWLIWRGFNGLFFFTDVIILFLISLAEKPLGFFSVPIWSVGTAPSLSLGLRCLFQGPLKIWTKHSDFPLQGRGDTKTPIVLVRPNICFEKKM